MKAQKRRLFMWAIVLLAVLLPSIADAYTICNTYRDGCTICDFYNSHDEWIGYMEWCN